MHLLLSFSIISLERLVFVYAQEQSGQIHSCILARFLFLSTHYSLYTRHTQFAWVALKASSAVSSGNYSPICIWMRSGSSSHYLDCMYVISPLVVSRCNELSERRKSFPFPHNIHVLCSRVQCGALGYQNNRYTLFCCWTTLADGLLLVSRLSVYVRAEGDCFYALFFLVSSAFTPACAGTLRWLWSHFWLVNFFIVIHLY